MRYRDTPDRQPLSIEDRNDGEETESLETDTPHYRSSSHLLTFPCFLVCLLFIGTNILSYRLGKHRFSASQSLSSGLTAWLNNTELLFRTVAGYPHQDARLCSKELEVYNYFQEYNFNDLKCFCDNPVIPQRHHRKKDWTQRHEENLHRLAQFWPYPTERKKLDVMLFGDSITHNWVYGYDANITHWYEYYFNSSQAELQGISMGIGGDRTEHLLYRLQNGELPHNISVPIIWVLIGTNNFKGACSVESIFTGVLGVIKEILSRPFVKHVVVNSILPRDGKPKVIDQGSTNLLDPTDSTNMSIHYLLDSDLIWQMTQKINRELEQYVNRHKDKRSSKEAALEFFDATSIFSFSHSTDHGSNVTLRNGTMFQFDPSTPPNHVHPGAVGYEMWGRAMVKRMKELL